MRKPIRLLALLGGAALLVPTGAAVDAAPLAAAPSAGLPTAASYPWTGAWDTDWGPMTLTQSGSSVTGTYTHDSGRIEGTASGRGLTGRWSESPSYAGPTDAGTFTWTMSSDGTSFSGTWTYEGGGGGSWAGTRVGSPPSGGASGADADPGDRPDTEAPVVAIFPTQQPVRNGQKIHFNVIMNDDSGKAKLHVSLYSGGTLVGTSATGFVKVTGKSYPMTLRQWKTSQYGPFYLCAWAEDEAGNRTPKDVDCEWLSVEVPIERVSNGCGAAGWLQGVSNWVGDSDTYGSRKVVFRMACNLHDAAYAGATVRDPFTNAITDFRTMSRQAGDNKLEQDVIGLCQAKLNGPAWTHERTECIDAATSFFYVIVREFAKGAYDADVTKPGTQTETPSSTFPDGGARDNA